MPFLVLGTLLRMLRMPALAIFLSSLFMSLSIAPFVSAGIAVPRVTLRTIVLIVLSVFLIGMSTLRLIRRWSWRRRRLSLWRRRWRLNNRLWNWRRRNDRSPLKYRSGFNRRSRYGLRTSRYRGLWNELLIHQGRHNIKLIVIGMGVLRGLIRGGRSNRRGLKIEVIKHIKVIKRASSRSTSCRRRRRLRYRLFLEFLKIRGERIYLLRHLMHG